MPHDALDEGPDGDFPWLPRTPEGWLDTELMPIGTRRQTDRHGNVHLVDVEPTVTLRDGRCLRVSEILPPPPQDAA